MFNGPSLKIIICLFQLEYQFIQTKYEIICVWRVIYSFWWRNRNQFYIISYFAGYPWLGVHYQELLFVFHLVFCAGIQTHDLLTKSLLPLPPDSGSHLAKEKLATRVDLKAVWPGVKIKISPNFAKRCLKIATAVLLEKYCFSIA